MTIWHWLVIGIFAAVIFFCFLKIGRRKSDPDEITKVHGWLALLVAGLMVFGPLVGAGRIAGDLSQAEAQYPQLSTVAVWGTYKTVAWIVFSASAVLSIIAGYRLNSTRRIAAVRFAIWTLWLSGPGAALALGVVAPAVLFDGAQVDPESARGLMGAAIGAAIWTVYLLKSKRVKARYVEGDRPGVAVVAN